MELSPFKSITGSDTFWDGSTPNPLTACPFTLCRGFFTPQNRPCTPKIVGIFYMEGYKVKEKTAIVPHSAALYPLFQNSVGTLL
jgi:hypothetical protein